MSRIKAGLGVLAVVSLIGCGSPESPLVEEYRNQFLQAELDGKLISIRGAKDLIQGGDPAEGESSVEGGLEEPTEQTNAGEEFVIAGKIYGGDLSAFDEAKASFTIIELPEPGHDHEDPGDCVFCKRRLENAEMAVVHLVDPKNSLIEVPADQMLGLEVGMNVLAKGRVEQVGEMLVVRATQLSLMDETRAKSVYSTINGGP